MVVQLSIVRKAVFAVVLLFSIIALGLSAHLTQLTNRYFNLYFDFAALAIATAVLSMISLVVMEAVDTMRKGAVTSMILVELGWLSFMWILWLATGADAADATNGMKNTCNIKIRGASDLKTLCHEYSGIQAFAFLNWIILLGYTSTVLAFCIIALSRGHKNVWFSSVKDLDLSAPSSSGEKVVAHNTGPSILTPQYPPQNVVNPHAQV